MPTPPALNADLLLGTLGIPDGPLNANLLFGLRRDGGSLIASNGNPDQLSCCCPYTCNYCPELPYPDTYTVTIANIAVPDVSVPECLTCLTTGSGNMAGTDITGRYLNGTFTVTPNPLGNCVWSATIAISATLYSDNGCEIEEATYGPFLAQLVKTSATAWAFTIADAATGSIRLFHGEYDTEMAGCLDDFPTFTNDYTSWDCSGSGVPGGIWGSGGSATFTTP
jgi:hypothetical protein